MRTLLLYNPKAGTHRHRRLALLDRVLHQLQANGFDATATSTTACGSAGQLARQAIAAGVEAVFACGGDGTVHDALQGVANTQATLGILPLGSANVLARELRIPRDPVKAAQRFSPTNITAIPLGTLQQPGCAPGYFLSMAGAGPDGALMYRMLTTDRSRWGHWLYYAHALRSFLGHRFPPFTARYKASFKGANNALATGTINEWREQAAISIMALRIGNLGGLFGGIARGASIHSPAMRLLLVHPPSQLSLPLWFLSSWLRVSRLNPLLTIADVTEIACDYPQTPQNNTKITSCVHTEADGEWTGPLPIHLRLGPETIRLLLPEPGLPASPPRLDDR